MAASITRQQALAWRMRRQLLDPPGTLGVARAVGRLCGVQAQLAPSAELAVRVRRERSRPGEVGRALAEGRLVKTWAMRGALHLLSPENGAVFLSIMAPDRLWASWRRYFGTTTEQMDVLWQTIREVLQGEPLTRIELADAVAARRGLAFADKALRSSYGELLKALAWRGEVCFGPSREGRVTFTALQAVAPRWPGLVAADEAVPVAIASYLRAYGPATFDGLAAWLGGAVDKRRLRAWFRGLGDDLAEVEVDGRPAHVLAKDLDELVSTRPSGAVRLLPAFDQYVLGPGTEDPLVVPAGRRAAVSRQGGWIAPLVLVGGVVRGTWELRGSEVRIGWFRETGRPPREIVDAEVLRLSSILGRDLHAAIGLA
jgi:winged helix DNA-binding protein